MKTKYLRIAVLLMGLGFGTTVFAGTISNTTEAAIEAGTKTLGLNLSSGFLNTKSTCQSNYPASSNQVIFPRTNKDGITTTCGVNLSVPLPAGTTIKQVTLYGFGNLPIASVSDADHLELSGGTADLDDGDLNISDFTVSTYKGSPNYKQHSGNKLVADHLNITIGDSGPFVIMVTVTLKGGNISPSDYILNGVIINYTE